MDLNSQYQRRFAPSLFLPPMAPRLASGAGAGFSAFTNYQGPPTLAPAAVAAGGSLLSPSLPKPLFFSTESLGPLPYSAAPAAGAAVRRSPPSPGSEQQGPSASGLPPRGAGHRRSRSDFLVGFSRPHQLSLPVAPAAEGHSKSTDAAALEELFRSYRDQKVLGVLGSAGDSSNERKEHLQGNQVSGQLARSPANSSDNEAESWATGGGSANHPRHSRSLSMDSIMGNLSFGAMGQVSPSPRLLLPPPEAGAGGSLSHTASGPSGGAAAAASSNKLASGEFSESEMKKIMANDRLAEIAIADPKRVKRILANRVSAAKSKERRQKYMGELERKVHVLQMETTTLASKAALTQREYEALKIQNNEMKIRLQALDQQALLKDALNEALSSEVQRLKHIAGEASNPHLPKGLHHHMNRQILEQQLRQPQKQPSEAQQQQQPQESGQFKAQQKQWNP
ncbi:hypothetical protein BS78_02G245300 [Paspalum vaginatum]|nr:hypothetical protein BS78_02G245300 [Paspalum vaginatum]